MDTNQEIRNAITNTQNRVQILGLLRDLSSALDLIEIPHELKLSDRIYLCIHMGQDGTVAGPSPAELARPAARDEPEPASEPKPVAEEPEPAPEREPAPAPELKSGAWSDAEIDEMIALRLEGKSAAEIAPLIGRELKAVNNKLYRVKARIEAAEGEAEPIPGPEPTGAADRVPLADQGVHAHLDDIGSDATWTPELDLEMCELLVSGEKAGNVAAILEVDKDHVIARWKRLCPNTHIDEQTRLLKALRIRAGKEAA